MWVGPTSVGRFSRIVSSTPFDGHNRTALRSGSRAEFVAAELAGAGLWLGPILLASHTANGVYRTVCEGRSDFVTLGWITVPPIAQLSMVVAVWLAWVV